MCVCWWLSCDCCAVTCDITSPTPPSLPLPLPLFSLMHSESGWQLWLRLILKTMLYGTTPVSSWPSLKVRRSGHTPHPFHYVCHTPHPFHYVCHTPHGSAAWSASGFPVPIPHCNQSHDCSIGMADSHPVLHLSLKWFRLSPTNVHVWLQLVAPSTFEVVSAQSHQCARVVTATSCVFAILARYILTYCDVTGLSATWLIWAK